MTSGEWQPSVFLGGDIAEKVGKPKQQQGPDLHVYGSRTPCLILNMDSIFAVLMMPSPISDGACQRAMIGPAIGTWLRHAAI